MYRNNTSVLLYTLEQALNPQRNCFINGINTAKLRWLLSLEKLSKSRRKSLNYRRPKSFMTVISSKYFEVLQLDKEGRRKFNWNLFPCKFSHNKISAINSPNKFMNKGQLLAFSLFGVVSLRTRSREKIKSYLYQIFHKNDRANFI